MGLFKKNKNQRNPHLAAGSEGYSFRRSRTLTGTTSAKVKPSAEEKSQLKTPRLKAHEQRQLQQRLLRKLVIIAAIAAGIFYLFSTYAGHLTVQFAPGAATPTSTAYQKTLDDYLGANPLQHFGFAFDGRQAAMALKEKHPEILGVATDKAWYGGNVQLHATFRHPILVWQTAQQRFLVDDQGIVFTYDHYRKPVVAVTDQSGIAPDVGGSVASQRFIRFLGKLVGAVNASGKGTVISVIIPASTREIDLKLQGRDYLIKTHTDRDPAQQAADIVSALSYLDGKGIVPQYLDVRVGGKAFYK